MSNQIRFSVYDGNNLIHIGEWVPETTRNCAPDALADIRKRMGGNYAYRIERTGDSKVPNKVPMYRYTIKLGETTMYSKLLMENEKAKALIQIKEQFKGADITEVEI